LSELADLDLKLEELKNELEEILNPLESMTSTFSKFRDNIGGMEKPLGSFKPVAKEMNKSKFMKAVKGLKGVFQSLSSGGPAAAAMKLLFELLKPLLVLLKPFQVMLNLITGLISLMVSAALKPMFEAMQPVYDLLISMQPVFIELGTQIGLLLAAVMVPLVEIIVLLLPIFVQLIGIFVKIMAVALKPIIIILEFFAKVMTALMPIFLGLMELIMPLIELAMIPLMIILDILFMILEPFLPIFAELGEIFKILEPAIVIFGNILGVIVLGAIKGIAYGFALLIDIFTFGVAGAMKAVDDFFSSTEGKSIDSKPKKEPYTGPYYSEQYEQEAGRGDYIITEEEEEEEGEVAHRGLTELQRGGITLSEGVYHLHNKEIVAPLDPFTKEQNIQKALLSNILGELINQSSIQRKAYLEKEFRHVFE